MRNLSDSFFPPPLPSSRLIFIGSLAVAVAMGVEKNTEPEMYFDRINQVAPEENNKRKREIVESE
jgi:hypothetical protein